MNQAKPKIRLYVPGNYARGGELLLNTPQSHYLGDVMRLKPGDTIAVFNGHDGEWIASITQADKKSVILTLDLQREAHRASPDLWLAFAPLKNKSDLVVEKATELGVANIICVQTRHAVVKGVNMEKLTAHAIEAAEQCERHDIPSIEQSKELSTLLATWNEERTLLYGDETGGGHLFKEVLLEMRNKKLAILIGPEGGFAPDELKMLRSVPFARGFSMGPRILKADTAAVSALACVQAYAGDWHEKPRFEAS